MLLSLPVSIVSLAYLMNWKNEHLYAERDRAMIGKRVDVVFMGDSITALWAYPRPGHLFESHPEYVNRGIPGDHAALMLLRMPRDVFALRPRTVVFLGGINDLKAKSATNALRFLMPIEVEASIEIFAYMAKLHHERLILCSLTPVDERRLLMSLGVPPERIRHDQILAVNAWIEGFARSHGLTYVDYYSAMTDGHDRMPSDLTDDGIHPNASGFSVMEPIIQRAIQLSR